MFCLLEFWSHFPSPSSKQRALRQYKTTILHIFHKHILSGYQSTWKLHCNEIIYHLVAGKFLWNYNENLRIYATVMGLGCVELVNATTNHSYWWQAAPFINWSVKIGWHQDNISIHAWVNSRGIILKNWGERLLQWSGVCEIRTHNNQQLKLIASLSLFEYGHENWTTSS